MKYTKSKDGVERTNVRITLRFTREEVAEIKRLSKENNTDWRGWLESHAALGIEGELVGEDGSYLQHYGKGEG